MNYIKLFCIFIVLILGKVLFCAPVSVANGGTGVVTFTAYAVLCGGTTSTGPLQSIASVGTSGQALKSGGAAALPSFGTLAIAGGGTGATSLSAGVIQSDASVLSSLGVGSANQVLKNSAGTVGWALTGVLQIVSTNTTAVVDTSAGSDIPDDDTIPQNTEGTQVLTLSITPKSASSTLLIKFFVGGTPAASSAAISALFVDSTANALAAAYIYQAGTGGSYNGVLEYAVASGSTSARTYKIRVGGGGFRVNSGSSNNRKFGGVAATYLIIMEYI